MHENERPDDEKVPALSINEIREKLMLLTSGGEVKVVFHHILGGTHMQMYGYLYYRGEGKWEVRKDENSVQFHMPYVRLIDGRTILLRIS